MPLPQDQADMNKEITPFKSLFDLSGRTAVITGGGGGICGAVAIGLKEFGVSKIALIDISQERMRKVADTMLRRFDYEPLLLKVDVTDKEQVDKAVSKIIQEFNVIDILVNCHGIAHWSEAENMREEDWDKMISINLKGVFLMCQAVGRHMIKRRRGKIINIASMSGIIANRPQPQSHYNAAKAGVIMLTKSLASEWSRYNINVNCISPGYVLTPLVEEFLKSSPEYGDFWKTLIPLQRFAKPEEIVGAVIFLASDASSYVTGHNLVIDGGYTIW